MGRPTLNVLLSFAQFERELISERVRDKVAASKKKGLWIWAACRPWATTSKTASWSSTKLKPRLSLRSIGAIWRSSPFTRAGRAYGCRDQEQAPHAARWQQIWRPKILPR